jgi:hypothetical protein|tara:strand:+ start:927 stop:1124 length:198 start_codon:yes stop_codon:yes gene_type:complete
MPNVQDIIDYENGEMDWDRMVDMFQKLINSGEAWTLQGSYGRMAMRLVDDGECVLPEQNKKEEKE